MTGSARWGDLRKRMISGLVLAAVGLLAVWAGGNGFALLAALVAGVMVWELATMTAPDRSGAALVQAGFAALVLLAVHAARQPLLASALLLPGLAMLWGPRRDMAVAIAYACAIVLASYGLVLFRQAHGGLWLIWLVLVVVVTDVAGYFAGRTFGGPKFWPGVSPNKTWSGVVAGWLAAALVGVGFVALADGPASLPVLSALLAFAAQLGDISESAIKRRAGVKDASGLIPGHGGLLDRFDGLLGAALVMLVIALIVPLPVLGG